MSDNDSTHSETSSETQADSTPETTPETKSVDSIPPESKGEESTTEPLKSEEKKELVKELRKYKIKIDKEESELELDDDQIRNHIQKGLAADKKFKEAAEKRKEAEAFIELLRTNPKALLKHPALGLKAREIAEELLAEELEQEMMDPKEREIQKLKAELDARTKKDAEAAETARQAQEAEKVKGFEDHYVADIRTTIEKSGLPLNQGTVNAVRDYMLASMQAVMNEHDGDEAAQDAAIEKIKASDVIELVRKDFQAEVKKLFSSTDMTQLIEMIGEDGLKKIRDADMKRLKNPKVPVKEEDQPAEKPEKRRSKSKTVNEYFAELNKKLGD